MVGKWIVLPNDSQVLAVHAALLHTGEIVYFSGDENDQGQHDTGRIDHTRLFDCGTFAITNPHSPTKDLFCCGHAFLGDGRLLVAGGTSQFPGEPAGIHEHHSPGIRDSFAFDPVSRKWQVFPLMNPEPGKATGGGRWYPTLITLPTFQVLAMSGHPLAEPVEDSRHNNNTPEVFSLQSGTWSFLPGAPNDTFEISFDLVYFPRLHLLPNGTIFCSNVIGTVQSSQLIDPASGIRSFIGGAPGNDYSSRSRATTTSVLLPLLPENNYRPRVLLCGEAQPMIIDLGDQAPAWAPTSPRALPGTPKRTFLNAVLLPTGQVFVCGGVSDDVNFNDRTGVLTSEVFDPDSNQWSTGAAATVVRNYHSVALLMPDGRVWTAGSSHNHNQSFATPGVDNRELRIEVHEPPYYAMPRPQLSSVPNAFDYGATFDVSCPQAAMIRRVALVRAGSCTHAFNSDQRYVGLRFTVQPGNKLRVTAPPNNCIAPPGHYLLFAVDNQGVPSVGQFIRFPFLVAASGAAGDPATMVTAGQQHVFYRRTDGAINHIWWDSELHHDDWTAQAGAPAAAGDPATMVAAGQQHVFYRRTNGAINHIWWDGEFHHDRWTLVSATFAEHE